MNSTPEADYPLPPWKLAGEALLRLQTVPIERVKPNLPSGVSVVSVAPGRTLGGLFLAFYSEGSTLHYHELIVLSALIRRGAKLGGWISHIYVDDLQSLVAGRQQWGLPKQMADFSWRSAPAGLKVNVSVNGVGQLCQVNAVRPRHHLPVPIVAPVVSRQQDQWLCFSGLGSGRLGTASATVEIPASSPLMGLGLTGGRSLHLKQFDLEMPVAKRY